MTPTLPEALARVERLRDNRLRDAERAFQMAGLRDCVTTQPAIDAQRDAAALTRVLAEVQRLREALPTLEQVRQAEFAGLYQGWERCPACHGYKAAADKHLPDCWIARLAALLETP